MYYLVHPAINQFYLIHILFFFFFAKMPTANLSIQFHSQLTQYVNKNYRYFITQPQCHYHTSQIDSNSMVCFDNLLMRVPKDGLYSYSKYLQSAYYVPGCSKS